MAERKTRAASSNQSTTSRDQGTDLVSQLEPYFTTKAPFQLPASARKMLVQWLPWISLVLGIICIVAFLPLVGLGAFVSSLSVAYGYNEGGLIWLPILILLAQGIVLLVAFPGLKRRSMGAWKLLFWADVIFFVYNVANSFLYPTTLISGLLGAVISVVIGLYLLFQVKSAYK